MTPTRFLHIPRWSLRLSRAAVAGVITADSTLGIKSETILKMRIIDVTEIREYTKERVPSADFDGVYTFYYDETNNAGKFYVRELGFNSPFADNFVLGGIVHEGLPPDDVQSLIDGFLLQDSVKEVKFKHIAKGSFLDCMRSHKLHRFLTYINSSNLYIHYSSVKEAELTLVLSSVVRRRSTGFSSRCRRRWPAGMSCAGCAALSRTAASSGCCERNAGLRAVTVCARRAA